MKFTVKPRTGDALGEWLMHWYTGGTTPAFVEQDDGSIDAQECEYLKPPEHWLPYEREVADLARGRVLAAGCGAGRHALYLQEKGLDVTGIDVSPLALEVCRRRGLKKAVCLDFNDISTLPAGSFDTVTMLGNNFGLMADHANAERRFADLYRLTSPEGRVIAQTMDPYFTVSPEQLRYQQANRRKGRMAGRLRLRVRFRDLATPWFNYLFVSPGELKGMLSGTGWELERLVRPGGPRFAAVLRKTAGAARTAPDLFGALCKAWLEGAPDAEIFELENGLVAKGPGREAQFSGPAAWPAHFREALSSAAGRVLDSGCGAGRYSLFMQERGADVTAADASPLAAETAGKRGVIRTAALSLDAACRAYAPASFDTVALMDDNFGLLCGAAQSRRRLRQLAALTSPAGRILAETAAPAGPESAAIRRRRFGAAAGSWEKLRYFGKDGLRALLRGTGWKPGREFRDPGAPGTRYVVELVKA